MPTVAVDLEAPHRAAMAFLGAWQAQDFPTMYSLISFSSQETISPDAFRELYEDAQNTMTMNSLDFAGRGLNRIENLQAAQLEYDVTFHTNLLGDITDAGRRMSVILDTQSNQW